MLVVWTLSFWVLTVGLFEGVWNHIAINIVHWSGQVESLGFMFLRETPGDLIFELTGAFQFLVACILLSYSIDSLRALRLRECDKST